MQMNTNKVNLEPYQVTHFNKVLNILENEHSYMDVSTFGAGKTHITFAVAEKLKMKMVVICPKTTKNNWTKWSKYYGIEILSLMTYQLLRGKSGQVNHDLLEINDKKYYSTDKFDEYAKGGLLLVFDECHMAKNENTQLYSSHALVKSIIKFARLGYNCRVAILSATPSCKREHVTSIFKLLGVITSDKLYNYNRGNKIYELIGLQEAIDKCNRYDPDTTFHITSRPVNQGTSKTICHELYKRILKIYMVSSMPEPPIKSIKDSKNLYALMPPEDLQKLKDGVNMFSSATDYKFQTQEITYTGVNWGDITKSRIQIDSAKVPTICRLARQNLTDDYNCKVLLYFNYNNDMKTASNLLKEYKPLIMNGQTSNKERESIIKKFQKDDNEYRVIISNPKVGGMGIDLDDKYGNHLRYMYITPSYFFNDQYQATGRIHRKTTKSKATIRFVYSREFPYETGILNSMALKSSVSRDMITQKQTNVKFPGEYEEEIELTPEELNN